MSYIKGWNYALDKAITIIQQNLKTNDSEKIVELLRKEKVYYEA